MRPSLLALVLLGLTTEISYAQTPLVNLNASDTSAGTVTWDNTGTLGAFERVGNPHVETIKGIPAVSFDGIHDLYRGPKSVAAIEGSAPRSIAMWVYNPHIDSAEETLVAWGRRGGPSGTNISLNWGDNPAFGAATHWADDLGWEGAPKAGQWHFLVYTYDGKTARIYDNGVEKSSRAIALHTAAGFTVTIGAQNDANGNPLFANDADGSQLAGSFSLASLQILPVALSAAQIEEQFKANATHYGAVVPQTIVQKGRDEFNVGGFKLAVLRSTQTAAGLSPQGSDFDYLPSDRLQNRQADGYYHLGDLNLRYRSGTGPWKTVSSAADREDDVVPQQVAGTLVAADITPALGADSPLKVVREWVDDNGLVLRFKLTNASQSPVEIGALGAPMVFNNILTNRHLDEAHEKCSFSDPYLGGDAGYLQVTRLSGQGPAMLVTPEKGTQFQAYRPLHDDPTPRSVTFEGFYEWTALSKAYAENEWKNAQPWINPTSRTLAPGESATYGFRFTLSPSIRDIEPTLIAHQRPVAVGIPGYILPSDQNGRLFLHYTQPVKSITVEPAGAISFKADGKPTKNGWWGYSLRGLQTGRCRLNVTYADGLTQVINYNVILPEVQQVAHLGNFHAQKQWFSDPTDPFKRTNSFMPYDREHNQMVLQRENSWPVGLSDEMGAGPSVAMAMKNLEQPNADEVALLEKYVNGTLWGQLQNPDFSVKASLFYYEPKLLPDYHYTIHGGWDKARGETTWRAYNYPHVTAVYWALYHLARDRQGLVKQQTWQWYLEHAYQTALNMGKFGNGLDQFGLMVGSVFPEVLRDLRREGWTDKADQLEAYMKGRESHWVSLRYPFGSEMPWDSTGQEEVYSWSKRFGDDAKAQVTLDAITAYLPTVPNWAYNGAGRRYFDEAVNNTRWPDVMRITAHYGSALNAIPPLDAFKRQPDDTYLLRIGYAGIQQMLSDIDDEGFGSGDFDADPAILKFDPFTSDYGVGFFGYAQNAGTYVIQHPEFGWLGFGGDVTASANGEVRVTPRDGLRRRVFLAPLRLWLTLDAGTFSQVSFNTRTRQVTLTLSPATSAEPDALLRIGESATGDLPTKFAAPKNTPQVRGAYQFHLGAKPITISLKPTA